MKKEPTVLKVSCSLEHCWLYDNSWYWSETDRL